MERFVLAVMMMFTSGAAFASTGTQALYSALGVEEQALPAPRIYLKYQKSVGGLTCIRLNTMNEGDKFSCSVTLSRMKAAAIYAALNVEEKLLPEVRTKLKYQKSVGGLSCVKTNRLSSGDSFDCSISF